jgi:hypothetical protein
LYVAITRAKKKCILLTDYNSPSVFIRELIEGDYNVDSTDIKDKKFKSNPECHVCGADVDKVIDKKTKSVTFECSRKLFCGEKFKKCEKCGDLFLRSGCINEGCESWRWNKKCECCGDGLVHSRSFKNGKKGEMCNNDKCTNRFQNKCLYCNSVRTNKDDKNCSNPNCFAHDWKCQKCKSHVRLRPGPRGKFYGCSSFPQCNWTISKKYYKN